MPTPNHPIGDSDTSSSGEGRVPTPPPSYDSDWRGRIERARSAREEGRKARGGQANRVSG